MYIERPGSARRRVAKINRAWSRGAIRWWLVSFYIDPACTYYLLRSQKAPTHPLEFSSPPPCRVSAQRRSARFLCIGKTEVCDGDAFDTGSCYNKAIARGYTLGSAHAKIGCGPTGEKRFFFLTETVWRKTTERLASTNCRNNNASSPWSTTCD